MANKQEHKKSAGKPIQTAEELSLMRQKQQAAREAQARANSIARAQSAARAQALAKAKASAF